MTTCSWLRAYLAAVKCIQEDLLDIQNRNRKFIGEHFASFERNFQTLSDCDQLNFARQQINFDYDTKPSLLAITSAKSRSFRGALFTYKIDVINSMPFPLSYYLPMSLHPLNSVVVFLDDVATEEWRKSIRRT